MKHIYTLKFWKDIEGYIGLYQVSNVGQVRSLITNKILKPVPNRKGYLQVSLSKNGEVKNFRIHRLVAKAFLPNEEELPEVDHINGNKTDNRMANLQWISGIENLRKKETGIAIPRKVICVETGEIFDSVTDAAKSVNRKYLAVSRNLRGITQTCAGKHFEYYDGDDTE